ncbi:transcriptional regulator, LysR family [Desulfovibrio ferrophilus]|uniref:Transcriptional regulator, LysR family n=1 Tax=Desulfovibrio ferrophilus TaxID=241368 RepID=A0A2Z6B380_9BACT|nr:transcriptional regulator, LysR family [Desulfovibrio ferrophilus]
MELRQLKTFRVVAERGSFTRAAEDLHLAQSSVSAQIRALEEHLGVRLFDRLGRRVVLTEAGEKLLHFSRRMEQMADEMRSQLSGTGPLDGSLTIRMPETIGAEYMPDVVERFHAANPRAELNFINCDDAQLREELGTGRIDLAFLLIDGVNYANVAVDTLGIEPLVLVAAPDHPLSLLPGVTSRDMQGQKILHLRVD